MGRMIGIWRETVIDGCDSGDVGICEQTWERGKEGDGGNEGVAESTTVDVNEPVCGVSRGGSRGVDVEGI